MTALKDPILGETARLAMHTDAGGYERQKLLVLLAAYHDAGEQPTVNALRARLGLTLRQTASLLRALERQGLIRVQWAPPKSWRRNEYELLFAPHDDRKAGGEDARRRLPSESALARRGGGTPPQPAVLADD